MQTTVTCRRCAASVLVEKHSFEHLSIQWQVDARTTCEEISTATRTADEHPARVPRCHALDQTIRDGVRDGSIPVGEEDISAALRR